ncbi:hypothetical protein SEA_CECE_258 [Microbacterium phage Cece]|nr:hypothetical protein SEA_CECE_258 [Microbacterium phage Cece]
MTYYDIQKNADRLREFLEDGLALHPNSEESRKIAYNFAALLPVIVAGTDVEPEHITDMLVGVEPSEEGGLFDGDIEQRLNRLFSSVLGTTPSADVDPFQKLQSTFQDVMDPAKAVKLDPEPWVRTGSDLLGDFGLRSKERAGFNWVFSPRVGYSQDIQDYR